MATDTAPETYVCAVCGEAAPAPMTAECNWCDQRYHLNQRNDVEGKDCGQVWIDEQYMALQFACNTCLKGDPSTGAGRSSAAPRPRLITRPRKYKRRP
ncbi:MAG: hypothetical protein HY873_13470 [Chloroflexi bacterium]|nr:hypothetical protein [Chloroflexota bacterium]